MNRANRTKTLRLDEIFVKFSAKYHETFPLTHLPRWVSWSEAGAKMTYWWRNQSCWEHSERQMD